MTLDAMKVPLDKYCPLNDASLGIDESTARSARNRAAEVHYNEVSDPSKVAPQLRREGYASNVAHCAVECIGKIMRRYCLTADIGRTVTGTGIITKVQE